jgi:hypothetical protein
MGRQSSRRRNQRRNRKPARPVTPPPRGRGIGPVPIAIGVVLLVLIAVGLSYLSSRENNTSNSLTPVAANHPTVDGIQCSGAEQLAYHIHQYLELYDHGKHVQLPSEIGIPSSPPGNEYAATCYYWLHVHQAYPNIIHVESPTTRVYTLGQFFDLWKASKTYDVPAGDAFVVKAEAAAARGQLHVFVNGKAWKRSFRAIPLESHEVIAVEIGTPVVPPKPFTAWNGL